MDIKDFLHIECPECKAALLVEKKMDSWFCGHCGKKFDVPKETAPDETKPSAQSSAPADPVAGMTIKGGVLEKFDGTQAEVEIPDTVEKIASGAFRGCENITNVIVPDSVTEIADSAFENCTKLSGIRLPSQLKKISYKTFSGCDSLKTIVIPASVEQIMYNAMCCGLEEIIFESSTTLWETENEYTNPSFEVDKKGKGEGVSRIIFKGETYSAAEIFRFGNIESYLKSQGLCPNCGGKFGMFSKCRKCGTKKDY